MSDKGCFTPPTADEVDSFPRCATCGGIYAVECPPHVTPKGADTPNTAVSEDAVYALRKFRYDNGFHLFPEPTDGKDASEQEIRLLLIFAAGVAGRGDLSLPRTLEAHRVIRLVPEAVGAALFERTEP